MSDFVGGAVSGIFQPIGYPLDTYKTMMQNNTFKFQNIYKSSPFIGIRYPLQASIITTVLVLV